MPEALESPPAPPKPKHSFSVEEAQSARAIGVAKQAERKRLIRERVELALAAAKDVDFSLVSLTHVRELIVKLDALMYADPKPADFRDLANARRALQEQERQLAGRPLPSRADTRRQAAPPRPPAEPLPG